MWPTLHLGHSTWWMMCANAQRPVGSRQGQKSEEQSLSDRRALSSAILCRPIDAHYFTVSAEMQGPNSISSPSTTDSFFKWKKKSSPCGPYFTGTFRCVEAVRKRTLSQIVFQLSQHLVHHGGLVIDRRLDPESRNFPGRPHILPHPRRCEMRVAAELTLHSLKSNP